MRSATAAVARPAGGERRVVPTVLATDEQPFVFPRRWRRAGVAWWVVSAVAAAVAVFTVHTTLPFMVRVVLVAGLDTIPGLAVSRLLVRRSFPSMRPVWWLWLYGLRCFFIYGYLAAAVLMARWVIVRPTGAIAWGATRAVAVAFAAGALVLWGLAVRDTVRHGLGGRDRSEIVLDVVMGLVVLSGPVALLVRSLVDVPTADVLGVLAWLRPVDACFGIAAGVFWCAVLLRLLAQTAGLRAWSVDAVDLLAIVAALAGPPLVAVAPVVARHGSVLWLTVPLLVLAVILPGLICAGVMILARTRPSVRRSSGVAISALLVVSTADAWCQLAMALSGYRLPAGPLIVPACVNFGFFLTIPLFERRRDVEGLDRQAPPASMRRWDAVPAVVVCGAVALTVQFAVLPGGHPAMAIAIAGMLGGLVVLGAVRHYATIGEARRLHRRIRLMTDELYEQSRVDPLTGLSNRRALAERFPQLAASCARASRPLSVAMVDLDHFKRFNDEHGHVAGDQLLRQLAVQLHGVLRHEDVASRFGGEEFCLVLPGAEPQQVVSLLQRLRLSVHTMSPSDPPVGPTPWSAVLGASGPVRPSITFSAGVAAWRSGEAFDDVVRRADAACYAAKAAGRDRVVIDATDAGAAFTAAGMATATDRATTGAGGPLGQGARSAGAGAQVPAGEAPTGVLAADVPAGEAPSALLVAEMMAELSVAQAMAVADTLVAEALDAAGGSPTAASAVGGPARDPDRQG